LDSFTIPETTAEFFYDPKISKVWPASKIYEPLTRDRLIKEIEKLDDEFTFLDIGAHFGYFSVICADAAERMGKTATIYSFEPHPENFEVLKKNMAKYKNVHLFNSPILNEEKEVNFVAHNNESGLFTMTGNKGSHALDTRHISSFNIDFSKVKIIKNDTQGCEVAILKSLTPLIHPGCILITERPKPSAEIIKRQGLEFYPGDWIKACDTELNWWGIKV